MKRTFLLLVILVLSACSPEELPTQEGYVDIKVVSIINRGTPEDEAHLEDVIELVEATLNSKQFRKKLAKLEFTETNGLTTPEVYKVIMSGNGEINVYLGDLGLGKGGTYNRELNLIRINTYYLGNTHISHSAGTLTHEWLHSLGFNHNGAGDRRAVPYAVGDLVTNLNR